VEVVALCISLARRVRTILRPEEAAVSHNQRVGRWGEEKASEYLVERGYVISAHNVRTPYGEIDLLAHKEGLTIFVEVKARLSDAVGPPEVSVSPRKQEHMTACAEYYAQQHGIDHWRIDVIAVQKVDGRVQIVHFENAIS
jgi:putative endonuclease